MLNGNTSPLPPSRYERHDCTYVNLSSKFAVSNRTFETQYAPFYNARLALYIDHLTNAVEPKWGPDIPIKKLCDISVGERVAVIGTLCKQMELRPSILKEISEEHHLVPQAVVDDYSSDSDYLILEDDSQRILLQGEIDPHAHVTGIVIAVLGSEQEGGKFLVEDICYASVPDPTIGHVVQMDMYVMLVSGLGLRCADAMFPFQLLIDYVTGVLGNELEQEKASHIVKLIIAGNSLGISPKEKESSVKAKYLTRKTKATTVEGMKLLDELLLQLVSSIGVHIMPGEFDPANHMLPQQHMNIYMFPKSSKHMTFHTETNPYEAEINGVRFLGTSGQNIKDIMAYSRLDDPVEVMEKTLQWGHMAPTAPDTLNCYPYIDKDPFVLKSAPQVYFAGNMPKFGYKKYGHPKKGVTVISIPKFCETFTAVLVNLRTFAVETIKFTS